MCYSFDEYPVIFLLRGQFMKKARHFLPMLFLLLGCAVGTVSVVLALLSLNRVPLLWRVPEEAALCTQNLMEAICEGDYASASAQLAGAPDLGLDKGSQSAVEQLLWEAYQGSCAFQESGGLYVTETGLAQDVQFESLDLAAVLADTKLLWPQLLTSYVEAADSNSEIYDENGEFTDKIIQQTLLEAARQALTQEHAAVRTALTLQLVYKNGHWRVKPTDALLNIIGGITA